MKLKGGCAKAGALEHMHLNFIMHDLENTSLHKDHVWWALFHKALYNSHYKSHNA